MANILISTLKHTYLNLNLMLMQAKKTLMADVREVGAAASQLGHDLVLAGRNPKSDLHQASICMQVSLSLILRLMRGGLRVFFSILVLSSFMWSGALDCSGAPRHTLQYTSIAYFHHTDIYPLLNI